MVGFWLAGLIVNGLETASVSEPSIASSLYDPGADGKVAEDGDSVLGLHGKRAIQDAGIALQ